MPRDMRVPAGNHPHPEFTSGSSVKRIFYLSFCAFNSAKGWLTRRFTSAGLFLLGGLGAAAVVGLDTKQTVAYQAFTFLLALLVFSFVWSLRFRARFHARRKLPPFATVSEPLAYRVVIENLTEKKQTGLAFSEDLENPLPSFEEFSGTSEPGEGRRNVFDRWAGYHRWLGLFERKRMARIAEQPLPTIPPKGDHEIRVEILPGRRGYLRLAGLRISRSDPLGVARASVAIPSPQSLLVLPKRYPVPPIQLPGSRRHQPGGVSLASSVGDSEEFISLRDYRPGDPLRRIHWKTWAKKDKPVVKEYQDEFFVRHALILDTFQKAPLSDIFEEAVAVAASFTCTIQTQESLLDLMFVGTEAFCFTAGRGLAHTDKMLEILASVRPCTDKPFATLPPLVGQRASLLSGCICIFLSWDDERKGLIGFLKALNVPVLALVVTDQEGTAGLDPGPMKDHPEDLRFLHVGRVKEGLAAL